MDANRRMWNETAGVHERATLEQLLERVQDPDFSTFDALERRVFGLLGLEGRDVAQLSCNNGRELLSCKKAGAGRCVGFDISEAFVEQAERLAAHGGVEAEFVTSNVYDIPADYDGAFDLVYVTIGALGWLPDLERYFGVVRRLLRPGGHLFLYEMHPILDMFDAEAGPTLRHSYFRTEPYVVDEAPDYFDPKSVVAATSYWFHHKLSDVVTGVLANGLELRLLEEHPHDVSSVYASFEREPRLPLSYALVARRGA